MLESSNFHYLIKFIVRESFIFNATAARQIYDWQMLLIRPKQEFLQRKKSLEIISSIIT